MNFLSAINGVQRLLVKWGSILGLGVVLVYWYSIHPPGFSYRGYIEDFCADNSRIVMADSLQKYGKPHFTTDRFMAPDGMPVPYFSWSIERDWFGAYVWKWSKDFPFLWIYFGLILVGSYAGALWVLRKMGVAPAIAWVLALAAAVFHVPRHFKLWHHFEYIAQHWTVWGVFLDAWIWQRWVRERRWSWSLELWRGFVLLGVLGAPGYFWGPMVLQWSVVRGCMLGQLLIQKVRQPRGKENVSGDAAPIQVEGSWRAGLVPVVGGLILLTIQLRWFLPLVERVKAYGDLWQGLGWFAHASYFLRPLWMDFLPISRSVYPSFNAPETVVSVGWFLWVPALLGVYAVSRRRGGPGIRVALPFWILIVIAMLYASWNSEPHAFQRLFQSSVPFMKFFRVASRWGIFLPYFLIATIALTWPEWGRWRWTSRRLGVLAVALFLVSSVAELSWLAYPPQSLTPLHSSAVKLLEGVRSAPGTTVLDFPFCVAGGNGVCTGQQCPNYPKSIAGQCFTAWHDKKVYGLYQGRLVQAQCGIYDREPYRGWFHAWATQRCLTDTEWESLCQYLDSHTELSALLVYPEIWRGSTTPECQRKFQDYLGSPVDQGVFFGRPTHGGKREEEPIRILRYSPRCQKRPLESPTVPRTSPST